MSSTSTSGRTTHVSSEWNAVARTATALGFTADTFSAWRDSLSRVPARLYRAHPYRSEDPTTLTPLFAAEVWAGWPFLLTQGLPADAATHYALLRSEEAAADRGTQSSGGHHSARGENDSARGRNHGARGESSSARGESSSAPGTRTLPRLTFPGQAAADLAHSVPHIRDGWVAAQRKWADAQRRAAQLRASVVAAGELKDGGVRSRRH